MRAAILAVGSELLSTDRLDTNSLRLAAELERHGVELVEKGVLPDDPGRIEAAVARLVAEVDLVLITGGLGPTSDDLTREAVAAALGRSLSLDQRVVAAIEERFAQFEREMPAVNRRQAMVPDGARVLDNARGTAPGLLLDAGGCSVFLFPGVPYELEGLIDSDLVPWLAERAGGEARERVTLKVALVPESRLEEMIAPAYEEFGREAIAVLAKPGEITVRALASGPEQARRRRLDAMEARLRELLGGSVFGHGDGATLEAVVLDRLIEGGMTLATAESCTGGLLGARLTDVPGASAAYLGGVVSYSNDAKRQVLGVDRGLLDRHGAVSEPVARAMAEGVRQRFGADFAVSVTGIAGPGGGTPDKPVGTVHFAWCGVDGRQGWQAHRRVQLPMGRDAVRRISTQIALEVLRRRLLGVSETMDQSVGSQERAS